MMTSSITLVQRSGIFKYVLIFAVVVCLTYLWHQELRHSDTNQLISHQLQRKHHLPGDYSKPQTGQETSKNDKQKLNPNEFRDKKLKELTETAGDSLKLKSEQDMDETEVQKINSIRNSCGQLCDTSRQGTPGPFFDHVTAPVDCKAIYNNPFIDEGNSGPPPKKIPKEFWNEYSMGDRVPILEWYFNQKYLNSKARTPIWTKESVDGQIRLASQGRMMGPYVYNACRTLVDGIKHAPGIKNGRVLVVGSESPWVEAYVLNEGAKEVVTLEYGRIESKHPKIKTMIPSEFQKSFLNGSLGLFDAVVTFSSVEHSGLGRYGDRLNPWGDIITVARTWCVTKDKGSLVIGVPYENGKDYVLYNAGRVYGKVRFPFLSTNWKQHFKSDHGGLQITVVFTKTT
uniref:Uncharacterized protein LOC111135518 isoform X2 n=1 Tax=Crassostrea virginica TaxID=6565 RepID=A0A8B8EN76_CRAVI|nr:uncharacterized protein LOC111135518 isoform X2 [Crassostrea virginica]XP_022341370.1 uncharacterized protein LOC111135518 isoform X2 [Crassostrea virginica]